jgi:predicted protein tyrosine phosphatase
MTYEIMNRANALKATAEPNAPTTAIISITDTGDDKAKLHGRYWVKGLLEVQFLDVTEGSTNCITRKQAKEIADYAMLLYPCVERFIVHCEYGQCRSAGIAAALSEHFEGNDNGIFANPEYLPNRTCYNYVLDALRNRQMKESIPNDNNTEPKTPTGRDLTHIMLSDFKRYIDPCKWENFIRRTLNDTKERGIIVNIQDVWSVDGKELLKRIYQREYDIGTDGGCVLCCSVAGVENLNALLCLNMIRGVL